MLLEFLAWYRQQLASLLPPALLRIAAPDAVLVRSETGGRLAVGLRRRARVTELGELGLEDTATTLRRRLGRNPPRLVALALPAILLLERSVGLPLAAEAEHRNLLRYEMDRYTPFCDEDLCWSSTVERRDRARGRLHVRLSMVPKATIAGTLDRLTALGLTPGRIEIAGAPGGLRALPFGVPDPRRGQALRAAAIGCAGLALVATALPFLRQWQHSAAVEARIAELKPRVVEAAAIRRRIADRTTGDSAFIAEEARIGDALRVLATVTQILPDSTSLTGFTLRQRRLTLDGQAASAAALIPLLAVDPVIRDPSFAAPITRTGKGDAEVFSIRAEVAP